MRVCKGEREAGLLPISLKGVQDGLMSKAVESRRESQGNANPTYLTALLEANNAFGRFHSQRVFKNVQVI